MDKYLRPERLDADPAKANSAKIWTHWKRTFETFLKNKDSAEEVKLDLLINYISPDLYPYISNSTTYTAAIKILQDTFIKPINVIFARHSLASRRQDTGETLDQYLQALKLISEDCDFQAVSAQQNKEDCTRDAFISGIQSSKIRQRLLEHGTLTLAEAFEKARALDMAQQQALTYQPSNPPVSVLGSQVQTADDSEQETVGATSKNSMCYFCGGSRHTRRLCPARDNECQNCGKKGHFQKVCLSKRTVSHKNTRNTSAMGPIAVAAPTLKKTTVQVLVNGYNAHALIDTGSSLSFIDEAFLHNKRFQKSPFFGKITMASVTLATKISAYCCSTIQINENTYTNVKLYVMKDLCSDLILGHDMLRVHDTVEFSFGGDRPPLKICGSVGAALVEPIKIFSHLTNNCKPIAVKSRRHCTKDLEFMKAGPAQIWNNRN